MLLCIFHHEPLSCLEDEVCPVMVDCCSAYLHNPCFYPPTIQTRFRLPYPVLSFPLLEPIHHTWIILHNNQLLCFSCQSVNHMCAPLHCKYPRIRVIKGPHNIINALWVAGFLEIGTNIPSIRFYEDWINTDTLTCNVMSRT